jgi:hypothetical protein
LARYSAVRAAHNSFLATPQGCYDLRGYTPRTALRSFLHRCELRLAVLAVALLFAQVGAITHAYAHDGATNLRAHHSGAGSAVTGGTANSHDLCSDCMAFAPLLAAAGAPSSLPPLQHPGRAAGTRDVARSRVSFSPTVAFRSRAPPRSL